MQEVEILSDDGMCGPGEVQREGVLNGAEVVQLEDEVLREVFWGTPDDPADSDVRKTKLMA